MKNDIIFYREAEIDSIGWRIYKMVALLFFAFIAVEILSRLRLKPHSILINLVVFLILFVVLVFNEIKRIKAVTVLNKNLTIHYYILNKEKTKIINLNNLKMEFIFFATRHGGYFQLKFVSDKVWELNSNENWQLQDLKEIYLKIKEIKNETLSTDEEKFIKKVDDKINNKGFFSN